MCACVCVRVRVCVRACMCVLVHMCAYMHACLVYAHTCFGFCSRGILMLCSQLRYECLLYVFYFFVMKTFESGMILKTMYTQIVYTYVCVCVCVCMYVCMYVCSVRTFVCAFALEVFQCFVISSDMNVCEKQDVIAAMDLLLIL